MKKIDKQDLHERAESYRTSAYDECQYFNEEAERDAVAEFEKGETAKYFQNNALYVTGLVLKRLEAAKDGALTFPLRPYDAETIARLLSACTEAVYDAKGFDENLSDEETVKAWDANELVSGGYSTSAETPATQMQCDLRTALYEYATAAATYAKHIGSASLLEWAEMVDILDNRERWMFAQLSQDKALRVIELEKSAANRLRLDKIAAELPPFYKPRARKKAK